MPDIFDFFKENESKLNEAPPEQLWTKLERKLEADRRPKRKGIPFLQIWVIALTLILLIVAAVLVWQFEKERQHKQEPMETGKGTSSMPQDSIISK